MHISKLRNINGGVVPGRVVLQTGFASTPVSEPRELPRPREHQAQVRLVCLNPETS
jgi:hypothetical protein